MIYVSNGDVEYAWPCTFGNTKPFAKEGPGLVSIFFSMLGQFELVKMIKRSIKNKKNGQRKKWIPIL